LHRFARQHLRAPHRTCDQLSVRRATVVECAALLISHPASTDCEKCDRIDFYVRVFVRVYTSKSEVKNSCLRRGYVYQSMDTPEFYVHPVSRRLGRVSCVVWLTFALARGDRWGEWRTTSTKPRLLRHRL
jgi:hypothetical protein